MSPLRGSLSLIDSIERLGCKPSLTVGLLPRSKRHTHLARDHGR